MTNWLIIPDTHFPYCHEDIFDFLDAMANRFRVDRVAHVGDLADHHASSYHEVEPECYSAERELDLAREDCATLHSMFPDMDISNGNHCELPKRKAKTAGLPMQVLKDKNDLYEVGPGWRFADEHMIDIGGGHMMAVGHYYGKNLENTAAKMGCSSVQGHMHTQAGIGWARTKMSANFCMSVGCLIDPPHPAFNYHKARRTLGHEQLGCGVVLAGYPVWVPMLLRPNGRWIGKLPT